MALHSKIATFALVFAVSLINWTSWSPTSAQDECGDILIQDEFLGNFEYVEELALMMIIENENEYQRVRGGAAERSRFGDVWGGSYEDFRNSRSQYFSQYNYNHSIEESQKIVTANLSDSVINAWTQCILARTPGVMVVLNDITEQTFGFVISWLAPPGVTNPGEGYLLVNGAIENANTQNLMLQSSLGPNGWSTNWSIELFFQTIPETDIRIVMNLGGYTDSISIPYVEPIILCENQSDSDTVVLPLLHGGRVEWVNVACGGSIHHIEGTRDESYEAACFKALAVDQDGYDVSYDCGGTAGTDSATVATYHRNGQDFIINIALPCESVRSQINRPDLSC